MQLSPAATTLKSGLARIMRWPGMSWLIKIGIRLFVPRHQIGVVGIILDRQRRVLLLRHVFHPGTPWGPPGGWLGRREDPAGGLAREIREEVGLQATVGPLILARQDQHPPHLSLAFLVRVEPAPFDLNREVLEARWFAADELPQPMYRFMRQAIETAHSLYDDHHPFFGPIFGPDQATP